MEVNQRKDIAKKRRMFRVTFMISGMILIYLLTYVPTICMTFFDIFKMSYPELVLMDVSLWVYFIGTITNAIITLKFKFKGRLVGRQQSSNISLERQSTNIKYRTKNSLK